MAKKTVIRRLFKYLPVSIELQTAVTLDERADAGLDQDNASILTGEYSVVDDQSQDQVPDGVNTETGEITEPAPGQQPDTGTDELNLE
ncbi:recombinase RecT, partial [Pseudomonas aeruginosa]